ncbi:DUF7857 domain-containing protein [Halegenticoccus tardaugens]|uniref:DUF7857 domain-containing protein n=1 Tax=Halegenticoccus tardaugens TaxID=2071624 RepID=UPI00100A5428|nr:hypothetical protein [Halegenticoccus tardaugens]
MDSDSDEDDAGVGVVALDWTVDSADRVSLVSVRLRNPTPVDRLVRLRNRLDGPVLPPRTEGVPEEGWDDAGFETVVPAGGFVVAGYACPAPARGPPVEVVRDDRTEGDSSPTVADAVRRLGRPEPPREAVSPPPPTVPEPPTGTDVPLRRATSSDRAESAGGSNRADGTPDGVEGEYGVENSNDFEGVDGATLPGAVETWLADATSRIERAERLTNPSVSAATREVAAVGGLDGVDRLEARVSADAARLRTLADRATALAERAEATDVPVAALRRLA